MFYTLYSTNQDGLPQCGKSEGPQIYPSADTAISKRFHVRGIGNNLALPHLGITTCTNLFFFLKWDMFLQTISKIMGRIHKILLFYLKFGLKIVNAKVEPGSNLQDTQSPEFPQLNRYYREWKPIILLYFGVKTPNQTCISSSSLVEVHIRTTVKYGREAGDHSQKEVLRIRRAAHLTGVFGSGDVGMERVA